MMFPAFCTSAHCCRYFGIEVESYEDAKKIPDYTCPECQVGLLTFAFPPGWGEGLTHPNDFKHGDIPMRQFTYTYDGIEHELYIVNNMFVGVLGTNNGKVSFKLPTDRITYADVPAEWRGQRFFVNNIEVVAPKVAIEA